MAPMHGTVPAVTSLPDYEIRSRRALGTSNHPAPPPLLPPQESLTHQRDRLHATSESAHDTTHSTLLNHTKSSTN